MTADTMTLSGTTTAMKVGDLFEGRYRIEAQIGSGGFSDVYRAVQVDINRTVALKVLAPERVTTQHTQLETIVARFEREARLLSILRDPHTIVLYDFGRASSGKLYMVFEFIDGEALSDLLQAGEVFAPQRVLRVIGQLAESLREAHAAGVLHRDIKPGNIMVYDHAGRDDQIKLLDFGIAKMVGSDAESIITQDLTNDDTLVGTLRYMSPEQMRGRELGPSSDLYSLGLVGIEMLTGQRIIASDDLYQIITIKNDPSHRYLAPDADYPWPVIALLERMCAHKIGQRYADADALLEALARVEHALLTHNYDALELSKPAPYVAPPIADDLSSELTTPSGPHTAEIRAELEAISRRPSKLAAVALLLCALAVLALLAYVVVDSDPERAYAPAEEVATRSAPAPPDGARSPDASEAIASALARIDVGLETAQTRAGEAREAVHKMMIIRTSPDQAHISIAGLVERAPSPVEIDTAAVRFPVELTIERKGSSPFKVTIQEPSETFVVHLSDKGKPRTTSPTRKRYRKRKRKRRRRNARKKTTTPRNTRINLGRLDER